MRKLHTLILSGALTPHEHTVTDLLSAIALLNVHIVNKNDNETINTLADVSSLHQLNHHSIEQIIDYLRKRYLQVSDIADLFDNHSVLHQAFLALTKMEKIRLLNNHYLAMDNLSGLNQLYHLLASELTSVIT